MDRIKDFENYFIDREGNIYNKSGHKMTPQLDRGGYPMVWLFANGKRNARLVHRLVALQYIPQTDEYVNHINGNKQDNRVENLEWCSALYNAQHRDRMHPHMYDGCRKRVRCIETGEEFESHKAVAKHLNLSISNLAKAIREGRTYGGYHFENIE